MIVEDKRVTQRLVNMAEHGPLSGEVLGGKYLLGDLLGEGGFGAVYKGQHQLLDRSQAVKVLHEHYFRKPKFRERFLREARTVAALDHLHIVHVDDFGVEQQTARAYLVMPFVGGGTFRDVLQGRQELLGLEQVEYYLEQVCRALDYAHQRDIVHLDLKPLNLLVHEDGRLLLSDFGLAHWMKQQQLEGGTSLGHGTPHYMAPEHINGQPDKRSDVYALGVILYQMLVGRRPFEGATPEFVKIQHLTEQPAPLYTFRPELPLELEEVLQKALAKSVAQRYQSAGELLIAFKKALALVQERVRLAEEERVRKEVEEQERTRRDLLTKEHQAELERVRKEVEEQERARRDLLTKEHQAELKWIYEEVKKIEEQEHAHRDLLTKEHQAELERVREEAARKAEEEQIRKAQEEEMARGAEEERIRRAQLDLRAEIDRLEKAWEEAKQLQKAQEEIERLQKALKEAQKTEEIRARKVREQGTRKAREGRAEEQEAEDVTLASANSLPTKSRVLLALLALLTVALVFFVVLGLFTVWFPGFSGSIADWIVVGIAVAVAGIILISIMGALFNTERYNTNYYQDILISLEEAIRLNPNNAIAHINKGWVLDNLKRYQEALIAYQEAIRLNPNNAIAHANKGHALCGLKHYEEALTSLEEAIRLNPNNAIAHVNKGHALCELKRYEEALISLEEAIRLDPHDTVAHSNKSYILKQLGREKEVG